MDIYRIQVYLVLLLLCMCVVCDCKQMQCNIKLDLSACYSTEASNMSDVECVDTSVCHKQFNITYIQLEPYSADVVIDLMRMCCGGCTNVSKAMTITKISDLTEMIRNTSDFLFPVLGRSDSFKSYGYHFLPLIETRMIYYITLQPEYMMQELIVACINMWPLIIICLLMVVIAGFVGWLLETWRNKEEFPRTFFTGWFEGFWWSFISMTTVGYGDKVPRSVPARLFSVIWIFTGITTFSLVTAMLSSEITKTNSMPPPSMIGAKVGVLRHRLYEAIIIAKNGGVLVDIERTSVSEGVRELVMLLRKKEINGFVLDRYTLLLLYRHFTHKAYYKDVIEFLKKKTMQTEVLSLRGLYSYGMLIKSQVDFVFLKDFIMDNRDVINTCNDLLINKYSTEAGVENVMNPLFSTSGDIFWPSITVLGTIISMIILYGMIFEYRRRNHKLKDDTKMLTHLT